MLFKGKSWELHRAMLQSVLCQTLMVQIVH